jgi:hypothetical protein|tara:strand:- start:71 stop:337 length:267 start_codon:yes stop_codon:yes gene_type:complete
MVNEKRLFIASSEIFSDYQLEISLFNVSTLEDIINLFILSLKERLEELNLTNLIKKLSESNFHIHSHTIEDILTSEDDSIFYICDHQD